MKMATVSVDLQVDRSLLDPHFDGYKLSLKSLPIYRIELTGGVDEPKLSDSQYSYQHVKAFGIHNHLVLDRWNPNSIYFVDNNWDLKRITLHSERCLESPVKAFQIPEGANRRLVPGRHTVSLDFPSREWLVLADGTGRLCLINTGLRADSDTHPWKVCLCEAVLGEGKKFTLLHSLLHAEGETHRIHCLLLHVEAKGDDDRHVPDGQEDDTTTSSSTTTTFVTIIEWLTFMSGDLVSWSLERTRRLTGSCSPDYAVLESEGESVIVSSDRQFTMVYDSVKPVEEPVEPPKEELPPPAYTWTQNADEVTVNFIVLMDTRKADIAFRLSADEVELGIKNEKVLIAGQLYESVDVEGSTWTIENGRLELTLSKSVAKTWPLVVVSDKRGEMVVDPNEAAVIHERLAHLTSETLTPDPEEEKKQLYNAQQLEDCDMYPDETCVMSRIDGDTHQVTHQVHLGSNQWIFNAQLSETKPPAICLRHDVDGLLWQPSDQHAAGGELWEHTATFSALGYVQASKTNRKFSTCAPNVSYACISDCNKHIYIYWQPTPVPSPLRNRKTGREVGAVAKQQVISLDTADSILGLQATNERLFILTENVFFIIRMVK